MGGTEVSARSPQEMLYAIVSFYGNLVAFLGPRSLEWYRLDILYHS